MRFSVGSPQNAGNENVVRWMLSNAPKSPLESTVPFCLYSLTSKFLKKTCGENTDGEFVFEHLVYPRKDTQKMRAQPSHSDGFIFGHQSVIAIEAKWREPCYESVGQWLNNTNGDRDNRELVLKSWLKEIPWSGNSNTTPTDKIYNKFEYQCIHRIASACIEARQRKIKSKKVIYLLFKESEKMRNALQIPETDTGKNSKKIETIAKYIDPKKISIELYEIEFEILDNAYIACVKDYKENVLDIICNRNEKIAIKTQWLENNRNTMSRCLTALIDKKKVKFNG